MADYSRELNKGLKIFSQLFVGYRKQTGGVPLGFATPFENNAAFRKRKETILGWCGTREYVMNDDGTYKLDKDGRHVIVDVERKSYRSDADNFYWGIRDVNQVGDGFEYGAGKYQGFQFAKTDERFTTYTGPKLMLLKARITEDKWCDSYMNGLQTFEHSNYAIDKDGPMTAEQAGIELVEAEPFKDVTEAVEVAKARVTTNRTFLINYITE